MAKPTGTEDDNKISLNCEVCFESFNDAVDLKKPKMLTCGHSFCLSCLQYICTHGSVKCPSCRKYSRVSRSGVDGLPTNYAICKLLGEANLAQTKAGSEAVQKWLESIQLERYAEIFVEEGYDSMEAVIHLADDDMVEMGIKRGHRRIITAKVEELKEMKKSQEKSAKQSEKAALNYSKTKLMMETLRRLRLEILRNDAQVAAHEQPESEEPEGEIREIPVQLMRRGQAEIGNLMSIVSGRPQTMDMIKSLGETKEELIGKELAVVEQTERMIDYPTLEQLQPHGTLCKIVDVDLYVVSEHIQYTVEVLKHLEPMDLNEAGTVLTARIV